MKVRLVVIGKPKGPGLAAATAEYERRAGRYWPLDVRELRDVAGRSRRPDEVRDAEWERLAPACGRAHVVVCDRDGEAMTSEAFARWLERQREQGDVAFVIGGAHGLPAAAKDAAGTRLSLSPWTLPHELARLLLAEQLYRAGTILRGEPYHK